MNTHAATGALLLASMLGAGPLVGQGLPLAPVPPTGQTISPYFEGWYANPDGTFTLSFGYFNRSAREETVLPLGPANFIEPARFDGFQPEFFPPRRERGVFTVTVPPEYAEPGSEVVWTLVSQGETHFVRAKVGVPAYELSHAPMAMGSLPPVLEFHPDGAHGRSPRGITAGKPLTTAVGHPLTVTVWARDESHRGEGATVPVELAWYTHQGPAPATFEVVRDPDPAARGEAVTTVTFSEPGEYWLRVRASNFSARDSSPGDQCCWTNGYVQVNVTP